MLPPLPLNGLSLSFRALLVNKVPLELLDLQVPG